MMGRGMAGRGAEVAGQAMWQVFPEEEARLSAQLAAHDAERYRLDQEIREAVDRKRYSLDPEEVARAAAAERTYLLAMDRLMTLFAAWKVDCFSCTLRVLRYDPRKCASARLIGRSRLAAADTVPEGC